MITSVDTVIIGKNCPASYTDIDSLAVGDVAMFNQDRQLIVDEAGFEAAKSIYFGVAQNKINVVMPDGSVAEKANIYFSNKLDVKGIKSAVYCDYTAPTEDEIKIDLSNASIIAGHRYVIRIVYKDIETPGWQFTHTYEVVATTETADDLGNALLKKINKHANRRVNAAFASHKLTLTALPKDDNEGVYSLNEYSVVSMEASLYVTIPGALLSNVPEAVPGAVITKTAGNPGKGYWKQVRDMEVRMLGYKGHVFTDAYPIIEPKRNVTEGASYDYITIENDNLYLSPDNQYIKTTPLTTELYVEEAANLSASQFVKNLKAFITGIDTSAE